MKRLFWLFVAVFLFRLAFGLLHSEWRSIDERQTYLIGLKAFTTGTWPYFGPDVNVPSETTYDVQLPGALEGLLIALPLYALPIPEAPFILLNLMSAAAVVFLAWYICQRLPKFSLPWLAVWIAIAPWSLHLATHVYNPGYILAPAVLFFVGLMEAMPALRMGVIRPGLANAFMGLGVFLVMQVHFSYIYLLPLSAVALASQWNTPRRLSSAGAYALGATVALALVVPAYVKYGWSPGGSAAGYVVPFNWSNAVRFPAIAARFLSMAGFELPRFLGNDTATRLGFLTQHWWLLVPGLALAAVGVVQPAVMVFTWFRSRIDAPGWQPLRWLVAASLVMAGASFWFTMRRPLSHIFFVFFPLLMIYSCYCWSLFADKPRWRLAAKIFLVIGVLFQAGYAIAMAPTSSIYSDRAPVQRAIDEKDYRILGERRSKSIY